jgi:ABC-type transport system substrate-binding protein
MKNNDYWRDYINDLIITPPSYKGSITEVHISSNLNFSSRKTHLTSGAADMVSWEKEHANQIWDPDTDESLNPSIHVSTGSLSSDVLYLGFNMGNIFKTLNTPASTTASPFKNRNFRRAVSFSFDYDEYIDTIYYGFGVQAQGPIPQGMPNHNGSSFSFNYNITAAVEEWNLAMRDSDFVTTLNNLNNTMTFYYPESSALARVLLMSLIQDGLEKIHEHPAANQSGLLNDMQFKTQGLAWPTYLEYMENKTLPIYFLGWASDYADPANYLLPICYHTGIYAQRISYNNTNVNTWYELAIAETNPIQCEHYYNLIQEAVADDNPCLWVCQMQEFRTWRTWLYGSGLTYNPMHSIYFYHIYKTENIF